MKKILSALLVVSMLAAMLVCWTIPAAAAQGAWNTHARAAEELPGYDPNNKSSVAGYEYTDEGLKVTTADWSKSSATPWTHVSTTKKVDLKDGVYMEVRIDEFDYSAGDKWFNFNIWSEQAIEEGSGDAKYGYGVQTIIRPATNGKIQVSAPEWAYKQFTKSGADTGSAKMNNTQTADGKNIIILQVTYTDGEYAVTVNGAPAPKKVTDWMKETYAEDSEAYIGFTMQCANPKAKQSLTVTKFGKNANASKPTTDDRAADKKAAVTTSYDTAEIANPESVAAGTPAVFMGVPGNGVETSALRGIPKSVVGAIIDKNEDGSIHVLGNSELSDCGEWFVGYNTSYDIADFPVMLCITRDFCECGGSTLEDCYAFEMGYLYLATGDVAKAQSNMKVEVTAQEKLYYDSEGGHSYLCFVYDATADLKDGDEGKFEGRINATRFDFKTDTTTLGRNEFDVMCQAFFATEEDAIAWAEAYLAELGATAGSSDDDNTTDNGGEDDTQAPAGSETDTQAPVDSETDTQAPAGNDGDETDAPKAPAQTQAPAQTEAPAAEEAGCFGTVGFGAAMIVVASLAAGFVTFKKKRD